MSEKIKEVKLIKGVKEREQYRKDIVRVLAETKEPIPLYDLPGGIRDIKDLENQGLISIVRGGQTVNAASLTEKGKSCLVYEK